MNSTSSNGIQLICLADIDSVKLKRFQIFLESGIRTWCITGAKYLRLIAIVPDSSIESTVNKCILGITGKLDNYKMGPYQPDGVAVPVESKGELHCLIIFAQSLLEKLDHITVSYTVASTVSEEVFHTEIYGRTFELFGRLIPPAKTKHEFELFKATTFLLDEYLVGRYKAPLLADMFHIVDEDGQVTPLRIRYGGDLEDMIEQGLSILQDVKGSFDDCLQASIRYIFEPLSRDLAYQFVEGIYAEPNYENIYSKQMYKFHIPKAWAKIRSELKSAFDANLSTKELAIASISASIDNFLEQFIKC